MKDPNEGRVGSGVRSQESGVRWQESGGPVCLAELRKAVAEVSLPRVPRGYEPATPLCVYEDRIRWTQPSRCAATACRLRTCAGIALHGDPIPRSLLGSRKDGGSNEGQKTASPHGRKADVDW
jgi:hypothetical protein